MPTIEQQAAKLLEENNVRRAPVPVDAIARAVGLDVRYAPTTDDVSGALIRNGRFFTSFCEFRFPPAKKRPRRRYSWRWP
jgi:hypothetical protein